MRREERERHLREDALARRKILKLQEGGTGPAMHIVQCADSGYHTPLIATEATKCSDVVAIIESAREPETHAALVRCPDCCCCCCC